MPLEFFFVTSWFCVLKLFKNNRGQLSTGIVKVLNVACFSKIHHAIYKNNFSHV